MNFGARLARDNQIQRAGDATFRYDHGPKIGAFHDAFIVAEAEATRRISFGGFIVARDTAGLKNRLNIVAETNLTLAARKQNTKREETKFRKFIRSHRRILLSSENDRLAKMPMQSWLSTDTSRMQNSR